MFSLEINGWESDYGADDYMGGELFYVNLSDLVDENYSGWYELDYYSPNGGNNQVQVEVYINLTFSNIRSLSYPDDFETTWDGSQLISAVYCPFLHYDTNDRGDIPGIGTIYQQVYYGYDPLIDSNVYLIYYMFYYSAEWDNFGLNFGHYYDFEPLLMFVKDIGLTPYRIVYRDVGPYTLPPKVVIQDIYGNESSGSFNSSISTPLLPLIGKECMVDYVTRNNSWTIGEYWKETNHGYTPFMKVPVFTITNSYHQMELGTVFWDAVVTNPTSYLAPMSDNVLRWGYCLLDEAFASDINVYEGVNLWNGADYKVPTNMSLTFDMLHNPFEFPYIVDCYEEIVHVTEAASNYKENGFYHDINFGLAFKVPATITMTVPDTVKKGQTYDISIELEIDEDNITLVFNYEILLGLVLHWWFIGIDEWLSYAGSCEFSVKLNNVTQLVNSIGVTEDVITGDYNGWISVSDFSKSVDLLGTLLNCIVEIRLFQIISDLVGLFSPGIKYIIELTRLFIDDIKLILTPSISGYVTTEIVEENSAISLATPELSFSEGETSSTLELDVAGGPSETSISLSNIQYQLEFNTDWSLECDFTDILNCFLNDADLSLGTYPSINASSQEHTIDADNTTQYDEKVVISVINDAVPPEIETARSHELPTSSDSVTVTATVTDDSAINEVILSYSTDGETSWENITMSGCANNEWTATIPVQSSGTHVSYKIYAEDMYANWAISSTESYDVNDDSATSMTHTTITTSTQTTGSTSIGEFLGSLGSVLPLAAVGGVVILIVYMRKKRSS